MHQKWQSLGGVGGNARERSGTYRMNMGNHGLTHELGQLCHPELDTQQSRPAVLLLVRDYVGGRHYYIGVFQGLRARIHSSSSRGPSATAAVAWTSEW
jgi:hypothetical protein